MEQKKIRINDWNVLNHLNRLYMVLNLEKLDNVLSGIIPKIFYHYEITSAENTFIVVPIEFEDQVRDIVDKTLVNSINLNYLSVGG